MSKNQPKQRKPLMNVRRDCKDPYLNYRLKKIRADREFNISEISKRTGIKEELIYAYERLRCFPPRDKARKIARVLGVRIEDIFPDKLRMLTKEIQRERRKKDLTNFIFLGSSLSRIEENLSWIVGEDATNYNSFLEQIEIIDMRLALEQALAGLGVRQAEVIRLRYGLENRREYGCECTLKEIGEYLNISRERARQIEAKAIRKLQHPSRAKFLIDFAFYEQKDI